MSRKMIYKIIVLILLIMVALVYSKNKDNGTNALKTTDIAPLFISIDHNNNEIKLSDYLGKYVVIYFFPKAFTPG
jgi:cytochrome oxidase Cu insertion factor (SCO1/SenC/PrrC family)